MVALYLTAFSANFFSTRTKCKCHIYIYIYYVLDLLEEQEQPVCSSYYSFFFSLLLQRLFANVEREKIDEEIAEKFEIGKFSSSSSPSNTIILADLGCAAGPNTFETMQHVVKSMKRTFRSACPDFPLPEFQVFFNDQVVKSPMNSKTYELIGSQYIPYSFYKIYKANNHQYVKRK